MKISQDKPFVSNTVKGANNKLFAVTNFETLASVDGETSYIAEAIEIKSVNDADNAIKQYNLNNIVSVSKSFYGDGESRGDLALLLLLKLAEGIDDTESVGTPWKTKDGKIDNITFGDVKTALLESITEKGKIVGVIK